MNKIICQECNIPFHCIYIHIATLKNYPYCDKCYKDNIDRVYEIFRLYFVLKKILNVNIYYSNPLGSNRIINIQGIT